MGVYNKFTYTNTGTEIDFMQGLIDIFTGLGATCEDTNGNPTTAAAQYADLTSASQATFVFNFGGNAKLTIQRRGTNNQAINFLNVSTPQSSTNNLAIAYAPEYATTQTERALNIAYYKSSNLNIIWLIWYNQTAITQASYNFACLKANNDVFYSSSTGYNAITGSFLGTTINGNLSALLQYSANAGYIDYIENAAFVSSGVKQFGTPAVSSCSTVPQFSNISLPNNKNYFSLSANLMVDVTPEPEEEEEEILDGQSDSVPSMQ